MQTPEQYSRGLQTFPQLPQFFTSKSVLVHFPPQHSHGGKSHSFPQLPQLL